MRMSLSTELIIHDNLNNYATSVLEFLEMNEAENGLLLGMLGLLKPVQAARPFMAAVKSNNETIAAAFHHDRNLIVTRGLEPALDVLAAALIARNIDVPGVVGPSGAAEAFSKTWSKARGCQHSLSIDQALYSLCKIDWPQGIRGSMRPMTAYDVDLVSEWILGFHLEALPHEPYSTEEARRNATARPQDGMTFIWEVEAQPVAMASLARPTAHGISVNAVYTPPEHRKRGYATALVAAISEEGLKRGKQFCVLYTDLTNLTSNLIYQKIGYRFVSGSRHYRFQYGSQHI